MKRRNRFLAYCLVAAMIVCVLLSGCAADEKTVAETEAIAVAVAETAAEETQIPAGTEETEEPENDNAITVSVYPFLPDVEFFSELLTDMWAEMEPDIPLNLKTWNAYAEDDPGDLDVLMYDALFTTYLIENGYIQPIEKSDIVDMEGIIPAAFDGATYEDQLYGIPNLMCSFFLIHWADDEEVAQADSFAELYDVLSVRKAESTDDKKDGLITNFESDYPYFYLDTLTDLTGKPDVSGEILNFDEPDPVALQEIYMIKDMQAEIEALENEELGQFAGTVLFGEGHGSAVYGYSEFMAYINDMVDQLTIRTISHCDGEDVPLYFADVVSLSADVTDPVKRENCIKLMNLMTSEEFITKVSLGKGEAQYLLPARYAVYDTLEQVYPMYDRLYELVSDERNHVMRYDAGVYTYLDNADEQLAIE